MYEISVRTSENTVGVQCGAQSVGTQCLLVVTLKLCGQIVEMLTR